MYERLTSRNWRTSEHMRADIYKRLALLEDGFEAGDIAFVKDLRQILTERLGEKNRLTDGERDIMEWVLKEIRT